MNLKFILITLSFIAINLTRDSFAELQHFPQETYLSNYDTDMEFFNNAALKIVQSLGWLRDELLEPDVFAHSNLSNISSQCNDDFALYVDGLKPPGLKKWAIKMADSTGKIESGILDGNAIFEGRYMQCVDANKGVENPPIKPLYCLGNWMTYLPTESPAFLSGLGICIPESCSDDDAAMLLETVYNPWIQGTTDVIVKCERESDWDISSNVEAIISIVILCLFGVLVIVASIFDALRSYISESTEKEIKVISYASTSAGRDNQAYTEHTYTTEPSIRAPSEILDNRNNNNDKMSEKEPANVSIAIFKPKDPVIEMTSTAERTKNEATTHELGSGDDDPGLAVRLLLCFSLYQNLPLIVSAKQPKNSIKCLNGLRVIAMSCVVLGHTYGNGYAIFDNGKVFVEESQKVGVQTITTMDVYVDTFFILSAFLVTISFLKQLQRRNGKLTPIDIGLHYFNRYWRLTPVYMLVLMVYTNLTMFMIPNGPFKFESTTDIDSCSTEWWKNMLYINIYWGKTDPICMGVSWYLCVDMQLFIIAPLFLYLLFRWEKLGIIAVVAAFCGGLIANIVLWEQYEPAWHVRITQTYLPILDDCLHVSSLYECEWTVAGKVTWSTLYRPMWGIWVCWVILTCHAGYGGILNSLLSWNFWVPLGKLTYLCYLIHMIVIYVYYYGSPVSLYFTHFYLVFVYFGILLTTYMSALVSAASLSAPLMRLAAVFLPARKDKAIR